jgi:hypothetical protein
MLADDLPPAKPRRRVGNKTSNGAIPTDNYRVKDVAVGLSSLSIILEYQPFLGSSKDSLQRMPCGSWDRGLRHQYIADIKVPVYW